MHYCYHGCCGSGLDFDLDLDLVPDRVVQVEHDLARTVRVAAGAWHALQSADPRYDEVHLPAPDAALPQDAAELPCVLLIAQLPGAAVLEAELVQEAPGGSTLATSSLPS